MIESVSESGPLSLPDPLPDSVPECHMLIYQMHNRILELEKQVRRRDRAIHGPTKARVPIDSIQGEGKEVYENTRAAVDEEIARSNPDLLPPPESGGGRKAPHCVDNEETVEHKETDPAKLLCNCGALCSEMSVRVSYQLEYRPARYVRIKHVEHVYSCPECGENVFTASKPLQPIDKGYPGPGLLAHIIQSKYAHHLPLYRQEKILLSLSVPIDRSMMSRWIQQAAQELRPLYDLMHKLILESRVIEADETNMPFIRKGAGRTITGKISCYRGDETRPYILYNFTENGKAENHIRILRGYQGFLLTDGASVFNGVLADPDQLRPGATSANCWAHVYRYFEDAKKAEEHLADYALGVIKSIFRIEDLVMSLPEEERVAVRQRMTKPLMDDFKEWLDLQKVDAAPTAFADAVRYTLNRWPALCRFLDHGFLKAHNNDSENALRPVVLGLNNWLFMGSAGGGQSAAILMSLIQTCRRLEMDSFEYLKDVLTRLPATPISQIWQFLPDVWKATRELEKEREQQKKTA